jgi:glycerol-3-phosphate dehydrogenase
VLETEVLIIGGGLTGAGIMRDLSLRGIRCLLIDKHDLCAGASGGNHGLLHSGARYVANDLRAAVECRQESDILKTAGPSMHRKYGGAFCRG